MYNTYMKTPAEYSRDKRARNPVKYFLIMKKSEAKKCGVLFNLTEDWYIAHFSQGCAVTGHELEPPYSGRSPWSAEIDRINPGGDYTMDNCRIVCRIFNSCRQDFSDDAVIEFAELLVSTLRS